MMENAHKNTELTLHSDIRRNLESTRKWAMFLAIVGFIFIGLLVLFGLLFAPLMSAFSGSDPISGFPTFILGLVYLILGVVYFFPLLFLFRFSRLTKKALQETDQESMNAAFSNLKAHYTFIGILTAIFLGLYVIIGLIAVVIAIFV